MILVSMLLACAMLLSAANAVIVTTIPYGCEETLPYANYAAQEILGCNSTIRPDKFCSSNKHCVLLKCQDLQQPDTLMWPASFDASTDSNYRHTYIVNYAGQADKVGCLCDGAIRFRFFEIDYADYVNAAAYCAVESYTPIPFSGGPVPQFMPPYITPGMIGNFALQSGNVGMFKVLGAPGATDQFAFTKAEVYGVSGQIYQVANTVGTTALVSLDQLFLVIKQQVGLPTLCTVKKYYDVEWSSVGTCSKGIYTLMPLVRNSAPINYTMNSGTFLTITPPASLIAQGAACLDGSTPCKSNGSWPGYCYFGQCTPLTAGDTCNFHGECFSNTCSSNACA